MNTKKNNQYYALTTPNILINISLAHEGFTCGRVQRWPHTITSCLVLKLARRAALPGVLLCFARRYKSKSNQNNFYFQ